MDMIKKQTTSIFAIFILMALLIPAVSADTCSFCEFINISNITRGVTDHALLTNLSADGHPQYILTNGTRAFTGKQSLGGFNLTDLLDPIAAQDAATKNYVDLVNASQTAYTNAAISLANTSMKNYVDTANTSMQAYVDAHTPITDHGLLSNLSGDGHPQYILVSGTRAFTGKQSIGGFNLTDLLDPVALQDAATKNYVDLVNASQTAYTNAAISLANTSMKNYVDAANASMKSYVDTKAVSDHGLLSNLTGDGHPQYILTAGTRAFTGKQSLGGFNLTDLLNPVAPQDAATKSYVDAIPIYNASYWTGTNYNATYAATAGTTKLSSDFYDPGVTTAVPGLTGAAISAGTSAVVATTANHPGVLYMRDSTTANGGYRYGCTGTQLIGGGETFEVVFQPVGVRSTQGAQLGWSDTAAANTLPVDGVWFNISGTGAAITLKGAASSNSGRTYTGSTYAPTTATWYRGTIGVNTAGTLVTYTIYNEAGASQWTDTVATNIPTGAGRDTSPCIIVAESTTDAAANILVMDYVNWGSTRTLVR